jgi:hypothetical protein
LVTWAFFTKINPYVQVAVCFFVAFFPQCNR